jgi:hypothetical protein
MAIESVSKMIILALIKVLYPIILFVVGYGVIIVLIIRDKGE